MMQCRILKHETLKKKLKIDTSKASTRCEAVDEMRVYQWGAKVMKPMRQPEMRPATGTVMNQPR